MYNAILNDKNEDTKKIIHIMVTTLCNRNCKFCCNKMYNLNDIPYVTHEELCEAELICITGGEPFLFSNPNTIAKYYKNKYDNIKKVYAYTNAKELYYYLSSQYDSYGALCNLDGLSISIKTKEDLEAFESLCYVSALYGKSNRVYNFLNTEPYILDEYKDNFQIIHRTWQTDFIPADDSIFRKA